MRYALINPEGGIDRTMETTEDQTKIATKPGWRWVPYPRVDAPAHDPETQALIGPLATVEAKRVVESWTVKPLTADEVEARKVQRAGGIDKPLFEIAFNHENRLRALEGKQPITRAQFQAAIKALI